MASGMENGLGPEFFEFEHFFKFEHFFEFEFEYS